MVLCALQRGIPLFSRYFGVPCTSRCDHLRQKSRYADPRAEYTICSVKTQRNNAAHAGLAAYFGVMCLYFKVAAYLIVAYFEPVLMREWQMPAREIIGSLVASASECCFGAPRVYVCVLVHGCVWHCCVRVTCAPTRRGIAVVFPVAPCKHAPFGRRRAACF